MGSYSDTLCTFVVPELLTGVQVVLGKRWQRLNRVIIDCEKQEVKIRPPGGRVTRIYPAGSVRGTSQNPVEDRAALEEMSLKQARKALRGGAAYFLMTVRLADTPEQSSLIADEGNNHTVTLNTMQAGSMGVTENGSTKNQPKEKESEGKPPGPPTHLITRELARKNGLLYPPELEEFLARYKSNVLLGNLPSDPKAYRGLDGNQHVIQLQEGAKPPRHRARRMSPAELRLCEEYVKELLQKGFIAPSKSPYSAPIMFIPKPAGGHRVVCDWRALNALTIKNKYPLPRIDDTLDKLGSAKIFSSLDLNSGYYQIRISEEDAHKTAFTTPMGLYEFKVLGQGLANAPATFQAVMNHIFAPCLNKFVVVYLDDILVFSDTPEQHMHHLQIVMDILKENKFYAKPEKCQFGLKEIKFLGHIVGNGGVKPDPAKVQAVQEWPVPKTAQEVRQFLGLANYFRRFIKDYAGIADPLIQLTSKASDVARQWSERHDHAFTSIKQALSSAPLLVHPDFSKPFELVSDASLIGTGAVLLQEGHPIAYTSKRFSKAEKNYTTTEQEMLGIVRALQEWRCYFTGDDGDLRLVTDHNPLTYFQSKATLSRRLERWVDFMSAFNYTWEYRKGVHNVADPISRSPALMVYALTPHAVEVLQRRPTGGPQQRHDLLKRIKEAYGGDPSFDPDKYELREGVYMLKERIVIPNAPALRQSIIAEVHDNPFYGHKGVQRTLEHLQRSFTWPRMRADVAEYVRQCQSCQQHKVPRVKPGGLLQPVEIPDGPWECVSLDFITCLPKTPRGNDALIVFVDKFSKMTHLVPCNLNIDARQCAEAYRDHVFKYHGLAKKFLTDRDSRFTGNFTEALTTALHSRQALSTSFHPQTDGQTEIMNQIVEDTIRHYVSPTQEDWDTWLTPVEFAINNSYQKSINTTPFRLNAGRDPHTPLTVDLPSKGPAAHNWLAEQAHWVQRAKHCIKAAQDRQQTYANQKRRPVEYKLNQWVWLSTRNLKLQVGGTKKFLPKYIGPFQITQLVGTGTEAAPRAPSAVKLDLPPTCKVHPVFHVSLLKEFVPRPGQVPQRPAIRVDADGVPVFEAEAIVQEKVKTSRGRTVRSFLVRWKGYSALDDTWEEEADILSPTLIREWRKKHPGPAPSGRAIVADVAPVTALRPRTRQETKRLAALQSHESLTLLGTQFNSWTHCKYKDLYHLALVHPTLAALMFWEREQGLPS